jgi:hypothetical protein
MCCSLTWRITRGRGAHFSFPALLYISDLSEKSQKKNLFKKVESFL